MKMLPARLCRHRRRLPFAETQIKCSQNGTGTRKLFHLRLQASEAFSLKGVGEFAVRSSPLFQYLHEEIAYCLFKQTLIVR